MPNTNSKHLLKSAGLFAGTLVVAGLATMGTQRLIRMDPFGGVSRSNRDAERLAFSLENVTITHYRGAKLITRANVDRIDVLKDQQNYYLKGVHNGLYRGEEGQVKFDGATAEWNTARRRLEVTSGAHVVNADFDLKVPKFQFDSFRSRLTVPGETTGKLGGGDIEAVGFAYNTKTKQWHTGKTSWTGPVSLLQDEPKAKRDLWQVTGDDGTGNGSTVRYKNGVAKNDDQIVTAQDVLQDRKAKTITVTGKVFYYSPKANMTCDKAVIYTEEKRVVLTGNVNMIIKPKGVDEKPKVEEIPPFRPMVPDAVSDARPAAPPPGENEDPIRQKDTMRKYPASVLAGKIEYFYKKGTRHAIITESPQAYQTLPSDRWRRVWTHDAFYDAEAETLKMNSTPGKKDTRMRNSIGDDALVNWMLVSTKEDDDNWSAAGIEGKFYNDEENENGGTKPPPAFERALKMPKLPMPTGTVGGGFWGLSGPIAGNKFTPRKTSPKAPITKKPHK